MVQWWPHAMRRCRLVCVRLWTSRVEWTVVARTHPRRGQHNHFSFNLLFEMQCLAFSQTNDWTNLCIHFSPQLTTLDSGHSTWFSFRDLHVFAIELIWLGSCGFCWTQMGMHFWFYLWLCAGEVFHLILQQMKILINKSTSSSYSKRWFALRNSLRSNEWIYRNISINKINRQRSHINTNERNKCASLRSIFCADVALAWPKACESRQMARRTDVSHKNV